MIGCEPLVCGGGLNRWCCDVNRFADDVNRLREGWVRVYGFFGWGCVIIPVGASIGETIVMGRNLQLRINELCHESWEKMEAGEGGWFCGGRSKVVVDFSVMSDREI